VSLCYSRAAGELIQLSARVSLNFGLPVDSCVVIGGVKLIRLSARLSRMVMSPVRATALRVSPMQGQF
jgi:hypothetical protein